MAQSQQTNQQQDQARQCASYLFKSVVVTQRHGSRERSITGQLTVVDTDGITISGKSDLRVSWESFRNIADAPNPDLASATAPTPYKEKNKP